MASVGVRIVMGGPEYHSGQACGAQSLIRAWGVQGGDRPQGATCIEYSVHTVACTQAHIFACGTLGLHMRTRAAAGGLE